MTATALRRIADALETLALDWEPGEDRDDVQTAVDVLRTQARMMPGWSHLLRQPEPEPEPETAVAPKWTRCMTPKARAAADAVSDAFILALGERLGEELTLRRARAEAKKMGIRPREAVDGSFRAWKAMLAKRAV